MMTVCVLAGMTFGVSVSATADVLQLENGDQLSGKVLSIDDRHIVLESESLGKVTVLREKVLGIQIGNRRPSSAGDAARSAQGQQNEPAAGPVAESGRPEQPRGPRISQQRLLEELQSRGLRIRSLDELHELMPKVTLPQGQPEQSPEDVLRQLRREGLDRTTFDEVSRQVPLMAIPGVRSYFGSTLEGLMRGQLDLHDLRQEAIKARDGLRDIQKDLGPSGDALHGYLMILDNFISQTEGSTTVAPTEPDHP
jgi:hypothetical protein